MANEKVLKRFKGNPIITASAVPRANSIHNSAIVPFEDGYAGIFRVDEVDFNFTMHVGKSKDGIKWEIDPDILKMESRDPEVPIQARTYDPRLTRIDDTYYFTWCIDSPHGPCIGLATTKDFKRFEQMENITYPANRNCVIFPRKINGKYAILHRPSDRGHTPFGDMFYSESPDLVYWGKHRFVFSTVTSSWQSTKIGPGPAPIEIDDGWLLIYHGVWTSCNGYLYYAGGAILDKDKPWKVLYRTKDYLLAPTETYERVGDVPNVVFPSSAVLMPGGKLRLYYGCADTCISMAEGNMGEIVDFIKTHSL
ncbi:MAG: glycoside hydrolase family 130 protein [Candidatus Omnitrophica bacterium]|nr:glycoside hydrolase family 130 protein [Candidatus Omnitrophota bacterium]MDD5487560.1 glycoside hydrolase family 130 protein [Candidatus Omnitrophota bacterium]